MLSAHDVKTTFAAVER